MTAEAGSARRTLVIRRRLKPQRGLRHCGFPRLAARRRPQRRRGWRGRVLAGPHSRAPAERAQKVRCLLGLMLWAALQVVVVRSFTPDAFRKAYPQPRMELFRALCWSSGRGSHATGPTLLRASWLAQAAIAERVAARLLLATSHRFQWVCLRSQGFSRLEEGRHQARPVSNMRIRPRRSADDAAGKVCRVLGCTHVVQPLVCACDWACTWMIHCRRETCQ